ncbi:unnamed protein product [Albugo candida]|uniref:Mitochondrial import inner membrane translocase subunit TIM22 n=1 Tax=Albugo candida TaxID=65357 RepID=A0A024G6D7_9STRA|nr:unnamed protein product [Albugo candida]|eukprot:CCI42390.1 unnamed protein product [Albugo candida]
MRFSYASRYTSKCVKVLPYVTSLGFCTGIDCLSSRAYTKPAQCGPASQESDCSSTTALLLLRGIGAGIAWTISVDFYSLLKLPDHVWLKDKTLHTAPQRRVQIAREVFKSVALLCGRNVLGFVTFLGLFGGVSCGLEILRHRKDALNPFCGGFVAALAVLSNEVNKPRAVLTSALFCGITSMGLWWSIPTSGSQSGMTAGSEVKNQECI